MRVFVERHKTTRITRARFDLTELDLRSKSFYFKHNLSDPRFTPVGLCSNKRPALNLFGLTPASVVGSMH